MMRKRESYLLLSVMTLALALAFVFAPRTEGQSERGQCLQECSTKYKACKRAGKSGQAACKKEFDTCRSDCREARRNENENENDNAKTEGSAAASAEAEANDNTNANGGSNTNGNTNGNLSPNADSGKDTLRGPANRNSNRPPA